MWAIIVYFSNHGSDAPDVWPDDGLPLAIIHAATPLENTILSANVEYDAAKGGVVAGQDIVVMLVHGSVVIRPLSLVFEPCGYPADLFSAMQDSFRPCPALIDINGNGIRMHGMNLFSNSAVFGFRK